jgi:uncharacterized protein (UPF0548 family)
MAGRHEASTLCGLVTTGDDMELSGIHLGRRRSGALAGLLAAADAGDPSYRHVGSTLREGPVPGIPDRSFSIEVPGSRAAASSTLRRWAPHAGIRARILPNGAVPEAGTTLLVVAPFGPFEMAVPDRIVAVVDEPERVGFAYGTLAGHAEVGEEAFLAEQIAPGRLRLTVRVHARPATVLARLGGPVVTRLQGAAARRYLSAWAAAIAEEDAA